LNRQGAKDAKNGNRLDFVNERTMNARSTCGTTFFQLFNQAVHGVMALQMPFCSPLNCNSAPPSYDRAA